MEEQQHKRRVRYKGTHPKTYTEKYKEHHPEKYADTIEKVIRKGSTPAGMHLPIMVQEILDFLQIKPGQKGLDATLGYGGHTRKMLEQLQGTGHICALDVDPIELVRTKERLEQAGYGTAQLTIIQENFAKIDLRLNPEKGISAAERLRELTPEELEGMLIENSDEPYAAKIAAEVTRTLRRKEPIETTTQLREVIEKALSFLPANNEKKELIKKTCQRTFQALRIDVNSEFEVLEAFLDKLPDALAPNGRVAILTFHSGEDRMVKKAFKQGKKQGVFCEISEEVIRPSGECRQNPRARSTKLRWAVKTS